MTGVRPNNAIQILISDQRDCIEIECAARRCQEILWEICSLVMRLNLRDVVKAAQFKSKLYCDRA